MFFDTRANPLSYRVNTFTAHKIKFPVRNFFSKYISKYEQIH